MGYRCAETVVILLLWVGVSSEAAAQQRTLNGESALPSVPGKPPANVADAGRETRTDPAPSPTPNPAPNPAPNPTPNPTPNPVPNQEPNPASNPALDPQVTSLGAQSQQHAATMARLTGMAEFGIGALTLPTATVCTDRTSGRCDEGDTSLMVEAWQLLRTSRRLAPGAGVTLGLFPTADVPPNSRPGVNRDHKRSYFTAEMILRGYFYTSPDWEAWAGATTGLVVISDTFSSTEALTGRALSGPRGVTTRTEGFTLGCALGVSRPILGNWTIGASLRYGFWNLPKDAARSPFGDEASLTGRNSMFLLGLSVGYKLNVY